jgi:hypothetical protein
MKLSKRRASIRLLSALAAAAVSLNCPAWAGLQDMLQSLDPDKPFSNNAVQNAVQKAQQQQPTEPTLENMFVRTDIPVQPLTPFSLEGTKIGGLTDHTVRQLAAQQFIVIDNSRFKNMADVYRDNRLRGKPNFVTVDCIVHPYFAFTNGVAAAVITKYAASDLELMLLGMFNCSAMQYKNSQDTDVRDDVEKNAAFLIVAMKLLHPDATIPTVGQANAMADSELKLIQNGKDAQSVIYGKQLDYSLFQPIGWAGSNPTLANFFKCYQWLSQNSFTLSDPAIGSAAGKDSASSAHAAGGGSAGDKSAAADHGAAGDVMQLPAAGDATAGNAASNEFRRSILLYECLQQGQVGTAPAFAQWKKVAAVMDILGSGAQPHDRILCPADYSATFGADKRISLNSLSEPLYRTKLLLSVRRSKPIEVGSASIFNQAEQRTSSDTTAFFRLFRPTEDVEIAWLKERAHAYTPEGAEGFETPLALLDLYAHASAQASNILTDMIWHLDPALAKQLPPLVKSLKGSGQQQYSVGQGRWQILEQYFRPFPDAAQPPLRTTPFLSRHIESAFAAWVDSKLSLLPLAPPAAPSAASIPEPSTTDGATSSGMANFQYLEPCPDLYRKIATDAKTFMQQLSDVGCLPDGAKEKFLDFSRLSSRLAGIADRELNYQAISQVDMKLLADIDLVLDKVSQPLPGTIYLNNGQPGKGCNLCLGRVGYLHVLCRTTKGEMLCRGAVYTYYEIAGGPITPEHWDRKLQFAMVRPPSWTNEFDIVQEGSVVRTVRNGSSSSNSAGGASVKTAAPAGGTGKPSTAAPSVGTK